MIVYLGSSIISQPAIKQKGNVFLCFCSLFLRQKIHYPGNLITSLHAAIFFLVCHKLLHGTLLPVSEKIIIPVYSGYTYCSQVVTEFEHLLLEIRLILQWYDISAFQDEPLSVKGPQRMAVIEHKQEWSTFPFPLFYLPSFKIEYIATSSWKVVWFIFKPPKGIKSMSGEFVWLLHLCV